MRHAAELAGFNGGVLMQDDDHDENSQELEEDQEEAIENFQEALLDVMDTGLPEEYVAVLLIRMAAELCALIGSPKKEFMNAASEVFDDVATESLLIQAQMQTPIEE